MQAGSTMSSVSRHIVVGDENADVALLELAHQIADVG
jgi:hypothetical protein